MAVYLFKDTQIAAVADAIRAKTGSSATMTIGQMPSAINSIRVDPEPYEGVWIQKYSSSAYDIRVPDANGSSVVYQLTDMVEVEFLIASSGQNMAVISATAGTTGGQTGMSGIAAGFVATAPSTILTFDNSASTTRYPLDTTSTKATLLKPYKVTFGANSTHTPYGMAYLFETMPPRPKCFDYRTKNVNYTVDSAYWEVFKTSMRGYDQFYSGVLKEVKIWNASTGELRAHIKGAKSGNQVGIYNVLRGTFSTLPSNHFREYTGSLT